MGHLQIDSDTNAAVKAHIQQQFDTLSWWPTEEPDKAKREYGVMNSNPAQLAYWCEKWLNGARWRQLENDVRKRLRSGKSAPDCDFARARERSRHPSAATLQTRADRR